MSFFKSFMTVSSLTIISRILGFLRDMLIARFLGTGPLADAFFIAFKLPNTFRRLFAEGAFSAAFIPLFAENIHHSKDQQKALEFAHNIFSILVLFLIPFTLLSQIFMPEVLFVIAPGFYDDPERLEKGIFYSRICFSYLIFISIVGLLSAILQTTYKFAVAAAAPILLNITLIIFLVCFIPLFPDKGETLSWGVFTAGVLQFLYLIWSVYKDNLLPKFHIPRFTKQIKKFFKLFFPGALSAGIFQINIFVGTIFASLIPNAVSYLYYADRLNQLPLGVIGIAIGTALLPLLSQQIKENKINQAIETQNKAIFFSLFLTLPATIALFILAEDIIWGLFEGGAFTHNDTIATAAALQFYVLGLPAYVLAKTLSPTFFANENTKTPMIISLWVLIFNTVFILILMPILGYKGIALAASLAGWGNTLFLFLSLKKRKLFYLKSNLTIQLIKIFLCSLAMGATLYVAKEHLLFTNSKFITLSVLVSIGLFVYFLTSSIVGTLKTKDLKKYLVK